MMVKTHLLLLAAVAALSVALFGFNLSLHARNRELEKQLNALLEREKFSNAPAPGWAMPQLSGKETNGNRIGIDFLDSAPTMTVLLFDPENCTACDENWLYWNKLRDDSDIGAHFMPITQAMSIPQDYRERHQIKQHFFLTGVDSGILGQMRMRATPQTIFMERGVVRRVWFGLLSDEDVEEISKAMKKGMHDDGE